MLPQHKNISFSCGNQTEQKPLIISNELFTDNLENRIGRALSTTIRSKFIQPSEKCVNDTNCDLGNGTLRKPNILNKQKQKIMRNMLKYFVSFELEI